MLTNSQQIRHLTLIWHRNKRGHDSLRASLWLTSFTSLQAQNFLEYNIYKKLKTRKFAQLLSVDLHYLIILHHAVTQLFIVRLNSFGQARPHAWLCVFLFEGSLYICLPVNVQGWCKRHVSGGFPVNSLVVDKK